MGRRDYIYVSTSCTGGINQQVESARVHQCTDARNVWAVNGRVEQRPGYEGVAFVGAGVQNPTPIGTPPLTNFRQDMPAGTFIASLNSSEVGDYVYLGLGSSLNTLNVALSATNSNDTTFKPQYWNGSEWKFVRVANWAGGQHLFQNDEVLLLAAPNDWASSTVNGQTKFFIRFLLIDNAFDSTVTIIGNGASPGADSNLRAAFVAQFPSTRRYLFLSRTGSSSVSPVPDSIVFTSNDHFIGNRDPVRIDLTAGQPGTGLDEPASIAILPQFQEMFVAYNHKVTIHKAFPTSGDDITAKVEDNDLLVGAGADFDRNLVAQEASFPQAKYIMFFRGLLWAANLEDQPFTVRWSGPVPYHKVWPSLQVEPLVEDDNSPITALNALGEYPVVFKNDSIWQLIFTGLRADNIAQFATVRTVAGTGCVSNSSVKKIRGRLIFLAEDGIYAFNGTPAIAKVTEDPKSGADRLRDTIAKITPGRRPFAAAAHWRKHSLYLLSVSIDGSDANNLVIVWDYLHDSWWLWDNIEAQVWLEDEDASDNERLFFGDSSGRIYELGVGRNDHGTAISSYVTTQRLGYRDGYKKRAAQVEILSSNKTRDLTVDVQPNDRTLSTNSGSLVLTDPNEKDWGTLVFGTDVYTEAVSRERRMNFRQDADWVRVKVSHSTKDQPMELSQIRIGFTPLGKR